MYITWAIPKTHRVGDWQENIRYVLLVWWKNVIRIGGKEKQSGYFDIPAWSLTALLKLIPKFSLEKDISNNAGYQLHYNYNTIYYDDPIDAAFEMICWLKEYKKLWLKKHIVLLK